MKKKDGKVLGENLLAAINKVLQHNKAGQTNKIEKAVKKSIRLIVKKIPKIQNRSKKKVKDTALNSNEVKQETVATPTL